MSVFSGSGSDMAEAQVGRCKRDYESEIKKAKESLSASEGLKNALEFYIDIHGPYFDRRDNGLTLPALYGALALEVRTGARKIETLIAEQERETK